MTSKSELATVYAALCLIDDEIAVTGEKLSTIIKAAGVDVEPYWPGLFAKSLEGINPRDLITNVGSGFGASAVASAPAAAASAPAAEAAPKVEEKKEESEESDDDIGFGLFDD